MEILQQFYENKPMKIAVESFLHETLKKFALEKLFNGEDAKSVAAAKEVVDRMFTDLVEEFEPVKKQESKNQSR